MPHSIKGVISHTRDLIGYLIVLTILTTSVFILFSATYRSFKSATGQELGTSTLYDSVQLQNTEEAQRAFKKYCSERLECTLHIFCKDFPRFCIFPVTNSDTTVTQVTPTTPIPPSGDANTVPDTTAVTERDVTIQITPQPEKVSTWCYWTRKFQLGGCENTTHPTAIPQRIITITPTPSTPSAHSSVTNPQAVQAPAAWCYDTDADNTETRGICRDATGTYYDSCDGAKVTEYVCQGTWNGKEYSNQRCTTKAVSCKSPAACQIGKCHEIVDTKQLMPTTISEANTSTDTTSRQPVQKTQPTTAQQPTISPVQLVPVIQKQELEPPVITAPVTGTTLTGTVTVSVDRKLFSTVTVLLQPRTTVKDQIYVGKVQTSDATVSWDTTLLPNGDYYLFAIAHGVGQKYISKPVELSIQHAESVAISKQSLVLPSDFKPERVKVDTNIAIEQVEAKQVESAQAIIFQGKAEPNSVISILIYSNPIVVTVRTDANGVWTYTLEEPLEPGNHTAYVVVPKADGSQIRSEINTFFVPPVYASSVDNQNLRSVEESESPLIRNFIILAVILILDAVMILLLVYHFKSKKNK